jgi:imidazolonepropionase-like amidohydrolase
MNPLLMAALAIVGGTVHPGDGAPISNATVVIEGDRIVAVGAGVPVPAGAQVIDAKGAVVTPGLIDAWCGLGLVEISGVAGGNDMGLRGPGGRAIRAAERAADSYNPFTPVIPIQRAHGVTTIQVRHGGALFDGLTAIYDLDGSTEPVDGSAMAVLRLGERGEGNRGAAINRARELIADARLLARDARAFERRQLRPLGARRVQVEALVPVVEGKRPLAIAAWRPADILAVLRFVEEEKLKAVLVTGTASWPVAAEIASARVPVILASPVNNLAWSFDFVGAREDAAKHLHAAGVRLAMATDDTHNVRKLRQWAGNAVRAGLPHDAALRAITSDAAGVLGLADRGRIAVGQVANVVVWTGDPFELSTHASAVVIRGVEQPLQHRQKLLMERYRTIPSPPATRKNGAG